MNGLKKKKEKMRDIKFRYVYQHKENKNRIYILNISLEDLERNYLDIHRCKREDEWDLISIDEHIGLKNKNGKEIYENDITIDGKKQYGKVFYSEKSASFLVNWHMNDGSWETDNCFYDVVSNIYENPKMLK